MGQASYPPNPIRRREATITVPRTIIVPRAEPTDEGGAILLVQGATASVTGRTAEPRAPPLSASDTERPFHFKLDELGMTVDGDGNLSPAQSADAQHGMVFQELVAGPVPRPSIT